MRHEANTETVGAGSLADTLFRLQDPWRSGFLTFLAGRAVGQASDGGVPTQEEVTAWLGNRSLYREVSLLLISWGRLAG